MTTPNATALAAAGRRIDSMLADPRLAACVAAMIARTSRKALTHHVATHGGPR